MITLVQTGENPNPVITVVHQKATRTFQIDYEEIALATTDAELSETIRRRLMQTIGDLPAPKKAYCCAHKPSCAVHQQPHDAAYVHCSCSEGAGRPRHKWSPSDLQFVPTSPHEN
jgi:hypothetical protein